MHKKILAYLFYPIAFVVLGIAKLACLFISKDKCVNSYGTGRANAQYSTRHRSWVVPTTDMQFEDGMFPMPHNYDAYLTALYGDYMQIPPKDKRIVHSTKIEFYDE